MFKIIMKKKLKFVVNITILLFSDRVGTIPIFSKIYEYFPFCQLKCIIIHYVIYLLDDVYKIETLG